MAAAVAVAGGWGGGGGGGSGSVHVLVSTGSFIVHVTSLSSYSRRIVSHEAHGKNTLTRPVCIKTCNETKRDSF